MDGLRKSPFSMEFKWLIEVWWVNWRQDADLRYFGTKALCNPPVFGCGQLILGCFDICLMIWNEIYSRYLPPLLVREVLYNRNSLPCDPDTSNTFLTVLQCVRGLHPKSSWKLIPPTWLQKVHQDPLWHVWINFEIFWRNALGLLG